MSRTPFRVSFFGGGTDYPGWYLKHGGQVLSTAIDKYCYITVRYLPPFFEHRIRAVYSLAELDSTAVTEVVRLLEESGADEFTRTVTERMAGEASAILDGLELPVAAKAQLRAIGAYLVNREG